MNPNKSDNPSIPVELDLFSPKSKAVFRRSSGGTVVSTSDNETLIHPLAYDIHEAVKSDEPLDTDSEYFYKCTFDSCPRKFKTAFERNRHVRNVHSSPEPCQYCGKLLKTKGRKDLLQRHLKSCPSYQGEED
eukprot:NODE_8_length_47770_cov_0.334354.p20 type:complete len:132 gc:universal NODE_8_length_47770_cov_0.334354:33518-33123(-)